MQYITLILFDSILLHNMCFHPPNKTVESTVRNNPRMPGMGPLFISILTSDTAFALDTAEGSHKNGIDKFWKRIKRHFERDQINSINLVMLRGKTVVAHRSSRPSEDAEYLGSDDDALSTLDLQSQRMVSITNLLRSLKEHLRFKSQDDFRHGKSAMQFDNKIFAQVDISISTLSNNRVGFQQILQSWARQSLAAVAGNIGCQLTQKVQLQLPETSDYDGKCMRVCRCFTFGSKNFAQFFYCCCRSFYYYILIAYSMPCRVAYKHIPCRNVASLNLEGLMVDLKLLSQAKLKIEQLVPVESIDLSLLFGVPILIEAGINGDKNEYRNNMDVARILFKKLGEQDRALLILSTGPFDEEDAIADNTARRALFHSDYQHFVLLPELESNRNGPASCQGVLYRLATSEHSFSRTTKVIDGLASHDEDDVEGFSFYVETSLDSLICGPINPMLLSTSRPVALALSTGLHQDAGEQKAEKKHVTWQEQSVNNDLVQGPLKSNSPARKCPNGIGTDEDGQKDTTSTSTVDKDHLYSDLHDDMDLRHCHEENESLASLSVEKDCASSATHSPTHADHSDSESPEKSVGAVATKDNTTKEDLLDSDTEDVGWRRSYLIEFPKLAATGDEDSDIEWTDDKADSPDINAKKRTSARSGRSGTIRTAKKLAKTCNKDDPKDSNEASSSESTADSDSGSSTRFEYCP
jgi:hypothetical protein